VPEAYEAMMPPAAMTAPMSTAPARTARGTPPLAIALPWRLDLALGKLLAYRLPDP
jgi:hypothetical protein